MWGPRDLAFNGIQNIHDQGMYMYGCVVCCIFLYSLENLVQANYSTQNTNYPTQPLCRIQIDSTGWTSFPVSHVVLNCFIP